jgi:hypothetical protein
MNALMMPIERDFTARSQTVESLIAPRQISIFTQKCTKENSHINALIPIARNSSRDCLKNMLTRELTIIYCLMYVKNVERDLEKSRDLRNILLLMERVQ